MKYFKLLIHLITYYCLISYSFAESSYKKASESVSEELNSSQIKLSETRKSISQEKIPLLEEIIELEDKVRIKQAEVDELLRLRDDRSLNLNELKSQVISLEGRNGYAAKNLYDYVQKFEMAVDYSERGNYGEAIRIAYDTHLNPDSSIREKFNTQIEVINIGIDRLKKIIGGYTYDGRALAPNGEIIHGNFAAFGPSIFFNSLDSKMQGMTIQMLNASEAVLTIPGKNYEQGLIKLINDQDGTLPLDPSLGKALAIEESNESLLEHIGHGGTIGIIIIALGLLSLSIGGYKYYQITKFKLPSPSAMSEILSSLKSNDISSAESKASVIEGESRDFLVSGIKNYSLEADNLEEILYEKLLSIKPNLDKYLPFMALTAAAAPLLGLLGTVTGMIKTFGLITIFGTGNARSLSSGISEALVTTELGLCVAIPTLIFHGLLSKQAKQKVGELHQISTMFINNKNK